MAARMAGATLAVGMAGALTAIQTMAGAPPSFRSLFSLILPLGVIIGGLLAFRHAPATLRADGPPIGVILAFTVQATVLGSIAVSGLGIVDDQLRGDVAPASPTAMAFQTLGLAAFGLLYLGLPIGIVVGVLVACWAWLLRRSTFAQDR